MEKNPQCIQSLLDNDLVLSNHARFLKKHQMYSAAVYYKNMNETIERRAARTARYIFESERLPAYRDGQQTFMAEGYSVGTGIPGDDALDYGLYISGNGSIIYNDEKFLRLHEKCTNSVEHHIVDSIARDCRAAYSSVSRPRYDHCGIHHVADMDFVLQKGMLGYRKKIEEKLASTKDPGVRQFEEGLLDVMIGIETFLQRYTESLEETAKNYSGDKARLLRLIQAIKKVPLHPAESFYEAYVSDTAVMFFADTLEPGLLDRYLYPYYEKDLKEGRTSPEEAYALIRELFETIERCSGHPDVTHTTVGGTCADGSPVYNALTEISIRAIGGLRTPNVTLRVRQDMPQYIWDAVLYNISKGYAQPAILNEEMTLKHLVEDYDIPYEDAVSFAFGGCSELMIAGKSMCDATWTAYNMLDIFEHTLYNHFLNCDTFDEFYSRLKEDYTVTLREMAQMINIRQWSFGLHLPFPAATLFTGGCIENAKSFSNGGAVYNFDSANVYGGTNTINSLYTLKQYYEGKLGNFSKEEFLEGLIHDFQGYDELFAKCKKVIKFGNYNEELNALASDLMDHVFSEIMKFQCYRSNSQYTGRFMPAIILWVDWIACGEHVGATPDGRVAGQATADSCGPMQGTDTEGPTSAMNAALSLPQYKCTGTCVLNLRLDPAIFKTPEGTAKVQMLFQSYFQQGGSQLQINVVDPDQLLAAMEDPENHQDIIVRVGGFSDNFVKLSDAIQEEVLKRTQHTL